MCDIREAIEQFCSYFEREVAEILHLAVTNVDNGIQPSSASGTLYRKVLFVTMLDTLAGVRFNRKEFPDLAKRNRARFSRFLLEHCSWPEANLVSLPFLLERLKEKNLDNRPLGQFVSEKLSRFSVEEARSVAATKMDESAEELLRHATNEREEVAIAEYQHIDLLYRYRNRLVHESREPGYAMEVFSNDPKPFYHGYLGHEKWHLGYPLSMFEMLVKNGLADLRAYLEANKIDPYNSVDDSRRW